jgi:hypothetical protein
MRLDSVARLRSTGGTRLQRVDYGVCDSSPPCERILLSVGLRRYPNA